MSQLIAWSYLSFESVFFLPFCIGAPNSNSLSSFSSTSLSIMSSNTEPQNTHSLLKMLSISASFCLICYSSCLVYFLYVSLVMDPATRIDPIVYVFYPVFCMK